MLKFIPRFFFYIVCGHPLITKRNNRASDYKQETKAPEVTNGSRLAVAMGMKERMEGWK